MTIDPDALLSMMPAAMAAALVALGDTIPRLGEAVMAGEISPEEAAKALGESLLPIFQTMAPTKEITDAP